jgi:DNA repair protein RecO (recombination protein O)
MLYKTRGIVLNFVKFRETSIITKVYTDLFGVQSYIVNQVRSGKPRYNMALFMPLTQLDMVVYHKTHPGINRISEVRLTKPYKSIPFEIRKSTVLLFLSEVLAKTLREETGDEQLFRFISEALDRFDDLPDNYTDFHLQFLLKYLKILGIEPAGKEDSLALIPEFTSGTQGTEIRIKSMIDQPYGRCFLTGNHQRTELLEAILKFLNLHFDMENNFRSAVILREVFRD